MTDIDIARKAMIYYDMSRFNIPDNVPSEELFEALLFRDLISFTVDDDGEGYIHGIDNLTQEEVESAIKEYYGE